MAPSNAPHFFSLEPPPQLAFDGLDEEPFARPARLFDVSEEGVQLFTRSVLASRASRLARSPFPPDRDDLEKSISERLMRIWQERGDFSQLTAASIRAGPTEPTDDEGDKDARPSAQEMRELQAQLMEQLTSV
jgi:hypothetical protein